MRDELNNFFQHKSLLKLTKEQPNGIDSPFSKVLSDKTKVTVLDTGVVLVEPSTTNNLNLVISSGVHGNETAPIEIVDQLLSKILSGQLTTKNRTLFIIGNPQAMLKGERFVIENMNRLFNGKHKGKEHFEAQRAEKLEHFVREFFSVDPDAKKMHFDLHTAIRGSKYKKFAIYPFQGERNWRKEPLQFFLESDINTVLFGHQPAGTFSYFSSHQFNADAFTVELGQVKPFGQNNMEEFSGINTSLEKLIEGQSFDYPDFNNSDFNLFQVKDELIKKSNDFQLHIDNGVENFTDFNDGFQLTTDSDGGYIVNQTGDAIVFPNANVPIGQRAGLVVSKMHLNV